MLQGDGKTVISVALGGTQPNTQIVVTLNDTRPGKASQWAVAYPIWSGGWMQSGNPNPNANIVASMIFSDLAES